jgi:hypothetical protein
MTITSNELEYARFRASAGVLHSFGKTPQEALDALLSNLVENEVPVIHIYPYNQEDKYFTSQQSERLKELRQKKENLSLEEREEIEALIDTELLATIDRTEHRNVTTKQ